MATCWISLLVILGIWRHLYKRYPLGYEPQYWSLVFSLGMYTVCNFQLAKALEFQPLLVISRFFVYIALAAWLAKFIGLGYRVVGLLFMAEGVKNHQKPSV